MSGEEDDPSPLHETLFIINYNLCKEFPALSPWEVDLRSFHAVIKLYGEMRTLQIHLEEIKDPNRVIRRKAGDDWF